MGVGWDSDTQPPLPTQHVACGERPYPASVQARVYVDGRITTPEKARLPVLDRGFLYGDSVYEVFWWHRGALIQAEEHFERLRESARRLYMPLPMPTADLEDAIAETCAAAGAGEQDDANVRLVITRGEGPMGLRLLDDPACRVIVVVSPAARPSEAQFEAGLRMALVSRLRISRRALDPGAKTGNYLNNVLALHEARLADADDAIMLNAAGEVTEATTSNVYIVSDDRLLTPPLDAGILKGTSRTRLLRMAPRDGLPAEERTLMPSDLITADEVLVSSSVRGVMPVTAVDGKPIGAGTPGPWTRKLKAHFDRLAHEEARAARDMRAAGG